MMVKNAKKEQPMKLKLRLCWTDAPARWAGLSEWRLRR